MRQYFGAIALNQFVWFLAFIKDLLVHLSLYNIGKIGIFLIWNKSQQSRVKFTEKG